VQKDSPDVPEHIAAMNRWSSVPAGSDSTVDQSQANKFSSSQVLPRPGTGLLSNSGLVLNWNDGNVQPPHSHYSQQQQYSQQPVYNPISVAEQDTLEHRIAQPQSTSQPGRGGQIWREVQMSQSVNPQAFMHGPVSPRESGITPFSNMYANGQVAQMSQMMPQAVQAPPMQRPASQPWYSPPMYGPNTNMPVMAMPGQQVGYPGAGGPPPFVHPPPGYGGKGKRPKKKRRFPIWARVLMSIFLLLLVATGGLFTYYELYFAKPISDITNQQVQRSKGEEDPNQGRTGDILSGPRINILLLGSDTDQKFGTSVGGSTVYLAQTDIVITIDPTSKQVGMLSIPRDFYLNIPGYGMGKLDEAFEHGYSIGQGGFQGAVDLSRRTIQQDFGIPINYYAWVGLNGFVKVIDTVGGIDVDVLHPITDDSYPDDVGNTTGDTYAYKRLYIPPGPQHLSGVEALEYVRSRHADLVGDFGRSARQQQVLSALKTKLSNSGIVSKLPNIAADLDGWVKTDMQLPDVLKLMNLARGLDPNKIQRVILSPPYSSSTTLPGGESIVQPHCDQIIPAIAKMFDLGNKAGCNIYANSGNSSNPTLASVSPTSNTSANTVAWPSQLASTSPMSLVGGSDNMFGFHGLLDLMFAVVFGSPQALQV